MLFYNPPITERQKQILRGTILGGSSLVNPSRGTYLSMRTKNRVWLEYKARELKNLTTPKPFTIEKTYRWHSQCYPMFTNFKKEFYHKGRRRLLLSSIDPLQDIGLGVWFLDAGKIIKNCVVLNTNIWGKRGSLVAAEYFGYIQYAAETYKERNCWRVRLDESSSRNFMILISRQFPEFL